MTALEQSLGQTNILVDSARKYQNVFTPTTPTLLMTGNEAN